MLSCEDPGNHLLRPHSTFHTSHSASLSTQITSAMQLALRVNVHEYKEFEPAIFFLLTRARNIFIKFRHVVSKRAQFTHVVNGYANMEEQKKLFAKAFKSHRI